MVGSQSVPTEQVPIPPVTEKTSSEAVQVVEPSAFDEALPRIIQCQFECVELSHEEMTKLFFLRDQSISDATKLRKELQQMVAENKAKIVDTMMVVTKSGQKATTESMLEYIYPTEYSQPTLPGGSDTNAITPEYIKNLEWVRKPITPTSFEPRNVGGALEVEPTLKNDYKTIELRFSWEVVDHEGEKVWMEYKDTTENTYKIEMPKFYTKRISTSITCVPASYTLVATVDPQNEKGVRDTSRKWLIFAKCVVQVVR